MENKQIEKEQSTTKRKSRLTVLELMSVLAILGILLTFIWQRFFA